MIKARSFYVATEYSCVATKFGLGWGFYVATEYYYVVTESSKTWVSMSQHSVLCHDSGARCCNKAGCAHAVKLCRARQALIAHDNVASCCVTTEEALRIRQTRLDAHDKPGNAQDKGLGA